MKKILLTILVASLLIFGLLLAACDSSSSSGGVIGSNNLKLSISANTQELIETSPGDFVQNDFTGNVDFNYIAGMRPYYFEIDDYINGSPTAEIKNGKLTINFEEVNEDVLGIVDDTMLTWWYFGPTVAVTGGNEKILTLVGLSEKDDGTGNHLIQLKEMKPSSLKYILYVYVSGPVTMKGIHLTGGSFPTTWDCDFSTGWNTVLASFGESDVSFVTGKPGNDYKWTVMPFHPHDY